MPSTPSSRLALSPAVIAATLLAVATPLAAGTPPDDLELQLVTSAVSRPVAVRHAGDGSGRLFIVEQAGTVAVYDPAGGGPPTTFLDIESVVDDSGNEQGLLGLAFHPDYATNGFFYVNYTRDPGAGLDRTVIERYSVSADPDVADPDSGFVILEINQDFSNHNGGDIHFGPDGYLYIGMGDGGSGGDPNNRAQNLGQLLGKMLRIDVDGAPAERGGFLCGLVNNYAIPADNPFVGTAGACDEIWAYGVRNPWRFSFDRMTGDLLIGDVGQNAWEEIDFQPADSAGGENYGWDCREGAHPFPGGSTCSGPVVDPILEYSHSGGNCSVTGGFRYRGTVIGGFAGTYVYADYCSGRIWFATQDGPGNWSSIEWMNTTISVTSFGEDEDGELYLVGSGALYRFVSEGAIFADGFESGNTAAWSNTVP